MKRHRWVVQPPYIIPTPALRWVLGKSFDAQNMESKSPPQCAEQVIRITRQLDLSARLAARAGDSLLRDLGATAARTLSQHRLAVTASNAVLWASLHEVTRVARELGAPFALLKFCALSSSGVVAAGTRDARDIDVLVSNQFVSALHSRLLNAGFRTLDAGRGHLSPLVGASCEIIEIHESIPGISVPSKKRAATFEDLQEAELLDSAAHPAGSWVPKREVLAAHALVHGLEQHGASPTSYPSFRYVSDLVDLLPKREDDSSFAYSCGRLVLNERIRCYVPAALRVARTLHLGGDPFGPHPESDEAVLFRHALAACCDPEYRQALKLARLVQIWGQHGLLAAARRALRSAAPRTEGASASGGGTRVLSTWSLAQDFMSALHSWLLLRTRQALHV